MGVNHYPESKLHPQAMAARNVSPPAAGGMNGRLPAANGELTVTTTHHGSSSGQSLKRSPSSLSPSCNDSSTTDLLADSPSKYERQTFCNYVKCYLLN